MLAQGRQGRAAVIAIGDMTVPVDENCRIQCLDRKRLCDLPPGINRPILARAMGALTKGAQLHGSVARIRVHNEYAEILAVFRGGQLTDVACEGFADGASGSHEDQQYGLAALLCETELLSLKGCGAHVRCSRATWC